MPAKQLLTVRRVTLVVLAMVSAFPQSVARAEVPKRLADPGIRRGPSVDATPQTQQAPAADHHMVVGRYYLARGDHAGALNRFRLVLLQFPASTDVAEALAGLVECYLTMGRPQTAQVAAAVLANRFPDSPWSGQARARLETDGLKPDIDAEPHARNVLKQILKAAD